MKELIVISHKIKIIALSIFVSCFAFILIILHLPIELFSQTLVHVLENQNPFLELSINNSYQLDEQAKMYLKINQQNYLIKILATNFNQESNNVEIDFEFVDQQNKPKLIIGSTINCVLIYDEVKVLDLFFI